MKPNVSVVYTGFRGSWGRGSGKQWGWHFVDWTQEKYSVLWKLVTSKNVIKATKINNFSTILMEIIRKFEKRFLFFCEHLGKDSENLENMDL